MLLGTLGASLFANLLTRKGILRAGSGHPSYENKKGKGIVRAVTENKKKKGFLMPPYQNEPRFNGVFFKK